MSYVNAQFWVNALQSFTAKVTNGIVYAADLNQATDEIEAIENILGTGLRSRTVVAWDNVSTSWSTLTARVNNLDAGVRTTDPTIHPQYALVSGGVHQPTDTTSVALTVRGGAGNTHNLLEIYATDSSSVLVAAQNSFTVGKPTTINSSLTVSSGASVSGGLLSTADTTTRVPLVSKGINLQAVDLFEVQDYLGNVLAAINQFGVLSTTGTYVANSTAGSVVVTVKAASGQTANIQNWVTSANATLVSIDASGNLTTVGYVSAAAGLTVTGGSSLTSDTASRVPLTVKGASGQWANLAEYKDSTGTLLAYVTSAGRAFFQGMYPSGATQIAGGTSVYTTNAYGDVNLIQAICTATGWSQVDRLQVWNGDGNARSNITFGLIAGLPANTGSVRCWSGSTGAAVTNINVRYEWMAWGH